MKLSTSSSIFLATLAFSSSTSALAAPARDATESGLSVSRSSHDMFDSSAHPGAHSSAHRTRPQPTPVGRNSEAIAARSTLHDIIAPLVSLPIVGPVLESVLGKIPATLGGQTLAETGDVSAQADMAALRVAVDEITQLLNNTIVSKVPSPVKTVATATGLIPLAQNDFDPAGSAASFASPSGASAMSSAQTSSTPSAVVNDVPSSSFASASASSTPASPLPINPPNTPSSPIHPPNTPSLPIRPPF